MRGSAVVMCLAACGFTHGAAIGTGDRAMIVDDSAADFAPGTLGDVAVDPLGFVVPDAFARGGLHARGYRTHGVTYTTTLADLTDALLGPLAGEHYGEVPAVDWMYDWPHGLGLTISDADSFTVVYDGEIYLAGATTLQLTCDDYAFFEIDLPADSPVVRCQYGANAGQITVSPPAAGWFPIRGAVDDLAGHANIMLSVGGASPQPITADVLRARVTSARGAVVIGAADRIFYALQPTTSIEPVLVNRDFSSGPPSYDLPNVFNGAGNFSLRYAAQLRADTAGDYIFIIDPGGEAGDYERLFVDGVPVAQHWPAMVEQPSATIQLAPGWHDLVLDYADYSGNDRVALQVQPPGAPSAMPIAADHLRPVRARDLLASTVGAPLTIADATAAGPTTSMVALPLVVPAGAALDFADLSFQLTGTTPRSELAVALVAAGTTDAMTMPPTAAYEGVADYMAARSTLAGASLAQGMQVTFTDNLYDGSYAYAQPVLVASYHGGPAAPYAQQMVYTSPPHATDRALSIDAITVTGDLAGAPLQLEARTGDLMTLLSAPWVAVDNGQPPAVAADAFVQYRLTIAGDGWQYPTIDRVEIDYTVLPP